MSSDNEIKEAIQQLAGTHLKDEVFIDVCTVTSVDVASRTCSCDAISGPTVTGFINVRLMAEVDDGILYLPSIGSTVIIAYSKRNLPFVVMYSQLDKIVLDAGSSSLQITDGIIQLNDGSLGGLPKVEALTAKFNNIETLLNDLITKFNTHTHVLALSTGTGTAAPTAAPETGTLTPTQQSDIENTTITHGI